LSRLQERGLIEALPAADRRRPYRITAAGAQALREYLQQARQVSTVGLKRLEAWA
jgi:DNA-binding PadR family transcriptional regulator